MDGLFGVGPAELVMIFVVALVVFGPKRLPELGRTVGSLTRRLRNASQEFQQEFQREMNRLDIEPNSADDDELPPYIYTPPANAETTDLDHQPHASETTAIINASPDETPPRQMP